MHLKREKIRSTVQKGQKVIDVEGPKVYGGMFSFSSTQQWDSNLLRCICFLTRTCLQKTYTGVDTLGKELFMYLGSQALR